MRQPLLLYGILDDPEKAEAGSADGDEGTDQTEEQARTLHS